jgi:hypothetical protein
MPASATRSTPRSKPWPAAALLTARGPDLGQKASEDLEHLVGVALEHEEVAVALDPAVGQPDELGVRAPSAQHLGRSRLDRMGVRRVLAAGQEPDGHPGEPGRVVDDRQARDDAEPLEQHGRGQPDHAGAQGADVLRREAGARGDRLVPDVGVLVEVGTPSVDVEAHAGVAEHDLGDLPVVGHHLRVGRGVRRRRAGDGDHAGDEPALAGDELPRHRPAHGVADHDRGPADDVAQEPAIAVDHVGVGDLQRVAVSRPAPARPVRDPALPAPLGELVRPPRPSVRGGPEARSGRSAPVDEEHGRLVLPHRPEDLEV